MKIKVIKVGGAFLDDPAISQPFFQTMSGLLQSCKVVLVHGGGSSVERLMSDLGLVSEKIDGLRVTPAAHIDYVVGALAGSVNKKLCSLAAAAGLNPVGISLADGKLAQCSKVDPRLGFVGKVISGDSKLVHNLLQGDFMPIISSIGLDEDYALLNVNADQAAVAVAKTLNAELCLLSDVSGVLDQDKRLIADLNAAQINQHIQQGIITDGMAVKVHAALDAANTIGKPVTIASWKNVHLLNAEINDTNESFGTTILPNTVEGS
ncbi:acetylglutamate kinase [Aliiglaciecola sp. LCG003]|uniref:acetylglutamate kinase n=1 Tax=Aliiglaciecola sp. LCG003 TaxID=3053655 RepID=UPI0025742FAA|nr:acetylglutamate kinase [Aliiglaciecola sp. LCG003]WJG10023.1 acetylglutamate kinase [Aliiglaciecola sp. LCG003]